MNKKILLKNPIQIISILKRVTGELRMKVINNVWISFFIFMTFFLFAGCEFMSIEEDVDSDSSDRIVGGTEAQKGRYPYLVSLQDGEMPGHWCGGALIAADAVLTAGHCKGPNAIRAGVHYLKDKGVYIKIKKEYPHPKYKLSGNDYDFRVLILESKVPAEYGKIVKLNTSASVPTVGKPMTVMGWGETNPGRDWRGLSTVLMKVDVNSISNTECDASKGTIDGFEESYKGQITASMLCGKAAGKDSCQGDSGGPLVVPGATAANDVQVGVVSWGIGCAHKSFPGVYSRVSVAYDWIKETVCKNAQDKTTFQCSGGGGTPDPDPDPDPGTITQLTAGKEVIASAQMSRWVKYKITVPKNKKLMKIAMRNGTGDADLYVQYNAEPSSSSGNLCSPEKSKCRIAKPQAGTYYVFLYAKQAFSGVSLKVTIK